MTAAAPLTRTERRILERLAPWPPGQLAEINGSGPVGARTLELCRALQERGYVRLSAWGRCGFEKVPGDFVRITEAGRALLAAPTETPDQKGTAP